MLCGIERGLFRGNTVLKFGVTLPSAFAMMNIAMAIWTNGTHESRVIRANPRPRASFL
jgi:hypothetical protein